MDIEELPMDLQGPARDLRDGWSTQRAPPDGWRVAVLSANEFNQMGLHVDPGQEIHAFVPVIRLMPQHALGAVYWTPASRDVGGVRCVTPEAAAIARLYYIDLWALEASRIEDGD